MAKRQYVQGPLSDEEIAILKKMFPAESDLKIALRLNRSYAAVRSKRIELGFRRSEKREWTKKEINLLKKMYPIKSRAEIANLLDCKICQVQNKITELGLTKK